jgi:hypothetical protein
VFSKTSLSLRSMTIVRLAPVGPKVADVDAADAAAGHDVRYAHDRGRADQVRLDSSGGVRAPDDGEPFDAVPAASDAYRAAVAESASQREGRTVHRIGRVDDDVFGMAGDSGYRHVGLQLEAAAIRARADTWLQPGQDVSARRQHDGGAGIGWFIDGVVELLDVGDLDDGTGGRGGHDGKRGGGNEGCD